MNVAMMRAALFLAMVLAPCLAWAQATPTGKFTAGHPIISTGPTGSPYADGGGAAGSNKPNSGYLTELGITNTGTPFCINDALTNAQGGYHRLCFGANALGGGLISYDALGGASALPLSIELNGTQYPFPGTGTGNMVGPTPNPSAGHVVLWNGTLTTRDGGIAGFVSPTDSAFGAKCDGTTDDTVALQNTLNAATAGEPVVMIPPGKVCFSATGITVPANVRLVGGSVAAGNPPIDSAIKCPANSAITCVQVSTGAGGVQAGSVDNLAIDGTGTPVNGAVGLLFQSGYGDSATNVKVRNFDTCAKWQAVSPGGLAFIGINFKAALCKTHFLEFDGWAEARFFGGRIGEDGSGDYTGSADWVHYTNTACTSPGCGPNSIEFYGTQFNPGGTVAPNCMFNWSNMTAGSETLTEYKFIGVHAEVNDGGNLNPYYCTDNTVATLNNLHIQNSNIQNDGGSTAAVFSLNSATALQYWHVTHSALLGNITLNPSTAATAAFNQVTFDDITNVNAWSLTANGATHAGNQATFNNSYMGSGLTLAGKWDLSLTMLGDTMPNNVTDTATGTVYMEEPVQTWTPSMKFGGATTGWAFTQSGQYWRTPNGGFDATYTVNVNTVGSATGNASITGLPIACYLTPGFPSDVAGTTNLAASLTNGPPVMQFDGATPKQFLPFTWGNTAWVQLTNTQFASTSATIQGVVHCPKAL